MAMDDKRLQETLEQVRTNPAEAEKFAKDPESYLRAKGIDTQELKFAQTKSGALSDADLESAAGGSSDLMAPTVCTSVGGGAGVTVCSSVGDTQEQAM